MMAFSHFRSKLPTFLSRSKKFPAFDKNATFFSNLRSLLQHEQQRLLIEKPLKMTARNYLSFPPSCKFATFSGQGLKIIKKSATTSSTSTSKVLVLLGSNGRRRMHYSSQANNGKEPFSSLREWLRNRMRSVGKCMIFVMIFGSLQMVPCSDRVHLVLSTDLPSKFLDWIKWRYYQWKFRGKILSPTSPEGVRVEKILGKILKGMYDGLGLQQHGYHVSVYSPEKNDCDEKRVIIQSGDDQKKITPKRRDGRFGIRYGFKHVQRMNWEIMLVDADFHNAEYLSDGKIVFYTGILKSAGIVKNERMLEDADSIDVYVDIIIATTMSHEVGHGLAHQKAEHFMRALWLHVLVVSPLCCHVGILPIGLLLTLIYRFFSRREELEADHLGMMLMAAAGYDPWYAPIVRWSHGLHHRDEDIFSTHPSGERRAKMLAKDKVVKQAMDIYKKVKAGQRFTFFN